MPTSQLIQLRNGHWIDPNLVSRVAYVTDVAHTIHIVEVKLTDSGASCELLYAVSLADAQNLVATTAALINTNRK